MSAEMIPMRRTQHEACARPVVIEYNGQRIEIGDCSKRRYHGGKCDAPSIALDR